MSPLVSHVGILYSYAYMPNKNRGRHLKIRSDLCDFDNAIQDQTDNASN